jgi:hypothetical protein
MIVLALCAGVSGCVSSPKGNVTPISMAQLIEKVRCELKESSEDAKYLRNGGSVAADLKLQTTDIGSFGPSFTPKDALSTPGETFSFALPFSYQSTTKRTYTQLFRIDLKTALDEECTQPGGIPVTGKIGVGNLLKEYETTYRYLKLKGGTDKTLGVQIGTIPNDKKALFTGTTEFTVKLSVGPAGPTWALNNLTAVLGLTGSYEAFGELKMAFVEIAIDPKPLPPVSTTREKGKNAPAAAVATPSPIINTDPDGFNLLLYNKDRLSD